MGNSQATVKNESTKTLFVVTFNKTDVFGVTLQNHYVLKPGECSVVEALNDIHGLQVGYAYEVDPNRKALLNIRWAVENNSTITFTSDKSGALLISGTGTQYSEPAKGSVPIVDDKVFAEAVSVLTAAASPSAIVG